MQDRVHLARRRGVGVRIWHRSHPRRQAERGREDEDLGQAPEHVGAGRVEPDLLARLAQRRGEVLLARIEPPAMITG